MADTTVISNKDDLVAACSSVDENPLNEPSIEVLYDIWSDYLEEHSSAHIILVPEWFSEKEFGIRRPFVFADIEHDDESSGAILFSSAEMVDISVVENDAYAFVSLSDTTETLDISDDDDYIDEAGKIWIPRSLMTLFEHE